MKNIILHEERLSCKEVGGGGSQDSWRSQKELHEILTKPYLHTMQTVDKESDSSVVQFFVDCLDDGSIAEFCKPSNNRGMSSVTQLLIYAAFNTSWYIAVLSIILQIVLICSLAHQYRFGYIPLLFVNILLILSR